VVPVAFVFCLYFFAMTDTEIMAAIGAEFQFDERPAMTKAKKSFLQKWNETHEAFKRSMQINSIQPEEPLRASSSSSATKDFFKLSPTPWTKTERTLSVRYDDIASDIQPSPTSTTSPSPSTTSLPTSPDQRSIAFMDQQWIRDFVPSEAPTRRLQTSASMGSLRSPTAQTIRVFRRARSMPHQMSDEDMDAWLEKPEDAEVHRLRTLSERILTSSVPGSKRGSVASFEQKRRHRKHVISLSPRAFSKERSTIPSVEEEPEMLHLSERTGISFTSLPDEVFLEVARHLDRKSVAQFRATSKRICDTVPAPLMPLAPKKT